MEISRGASTSTINKPVVVNKQGKEVKNAAANTPSMRGFVFQIRSLDTDDRLTFLNPFMEPPRESISGSEDSFNRPFVPRRSAQSIEGITETYSFQNILLDTRYSIGGTQEGGKRPNIEAIIEKLKRMMTPNPFRMRKQRVVVRFGSVQIGVPPETYLYINSVTPKAESVDPEGKYETCLLDIAASLYSFR